MAACIQKVSQMLVPLTSSLRSYEIPAVSLAARTLCSSPAFYQSTESTSSSPSKPAAAYESPELEEERPHMLNVVWRIRSLKRRPHWERKTMKQLMLNRMNFPVIHKNTESVNTLLREVRHLVRIKPVILNQGLPNGDYQSTLLKWNGEFVVRRKLNSVGKEIAAGEETSDLENDTRSEVTVEDKESK